MKSVSELIVYLSNWMQVLLTILLAEILTFICTYTQSILWWGYVSTDLLLIGVISAFFVSLILSPILILVVRFSARTNLEKEELKTEITERKRVEDELKSRTEELAFSKEVLEKTFSGIREGILIIDASTRTIEEVNRALEDMWGYSRQELLGRNTEFMHVDREAYESFGDLMRFYMSKKGEMHTDYEFRRKDGSTFVAGVSVTGLFDDKGEMVKLVGVFRDITESKQAEGLIRDSLEEKEVLLREIHHRVKNNLAIVSSMLDLQIMQLSDKGLISIFKESQGRIKSMALVHEYLYRSENLMKVDIKAYLESLIKSVSMSYGDGSTPVRIHVDIGPVDLDLDQLVPMGLIVNEALTNAYKYAFEGMDAGIINVELKRDGNSEIRLSIRDNGKGLPEGLDCDTAKTLGFRLIRTFARQLEGKLDIKVFDGVEVSLTLREA